MTKRQIDLARHALGLPNEDRRSYRNSFVAGLGHTDYDDWYAMTREGWAVRFDGAKLPFGDDDLFKLTLDGARAVLVAQETLDPEDFPAAENTMDFGQAIAALKAGKWVQRAGWNGKGMHVYLEDGWDETLPNTKAAGVFRDATRTYAPHIVMFSAEGIHQSGWLASQADMLAEDWQVVQHA